MKLQVDLDGDGAPERLVIRQKPADPAWRGQRGDLGPRFTVGVEGAGRVIIERKMAGIAQGWIRLPQRLPGGRHAAWLLWGSPDDSTPRAMAIGPLAGALRVLDLPRIPTTLVDLDGDGVDVMLCVSTELHQDYLKRGTMTAIAWDSSGPVDLLPFAAFEVCALGSGPGPLLLAAAERSRDRLHVLARSGPRLASVASAPVPGLSEGPAWHSESGFALACPGEGGLLHWKGRPWRWDGRGLSPEE
jgi:hypothetical protein